MNAVVLTIHGFDAQYEVEGASRSSAVGVAHQFRRTSDPAAGLVLRTNTPALLLEVTPHGREAWIGDFQGGAEGLDGVFATPSADTVCVVVKGQGYWVPVLAPERFELIRSIPIRHVVPVANRRVLLFVDYTRLAAYGANGCLWITEDLSWDGLEITEVNAAAVLGTGWDSPAGRRVSFSVDLDSGKAEGGSSPATYGADPRNARQP